MLSTLPKLRKHTPWSRSRSMTPHSPVGTRNTHIWRCGRSWPIRPLRRCFRRHRIRATHPATHALRARRVALGAVFPDWAGYFTDRAREAGLSTFYAGIHYPNDVDQGLALGQAVGKI